LEIDLAVMITSTVTKTALDEAFLTRIMFANCTFFYQILMHSSFERFSAIPTLFSRFVQYARRIQEVNQTT